MAYIEFFIFIKHIFQVFEANFSTTTPNDRLVSQLILMSSVQKYFNFNTYIACGITEVELLGTEADWRALIVKLQDIKKVLSPISGPLGNITAYFDDIVAPVYQNLLNTFLGKPDKAWWNDIVLRQAKVEQVGSDFLGRLNDLHTWQFPADRPTGLDKIRSSDWSKVGMLYR